MNLRNARFASRHLLLDTAQIGRRYISLRPAYKDQLLSPRTRMVIDGFPRSANSYARFAFEVAQGDSAGILAGHNHSADFVRSAVSAGLPTAVLVRHPDSSVASLHQSTGMSLSAGYRAYTRFHKEVMKCATNIIIAPFEIVTHDFNALIFGVNDKFGTAFSPLIGSDEEAQEIAARLESSNRSVSGGRVDERSVARPSSSRKSAAEVLAKASAGDLRARFAALESYEELMAHPSCLGCDR